ncbi:MAG: polyprenyl synthetase family protein [Methanobacteriota archaeon]
MDARSALKEKGALVEPVIRKYLDSENATLKKMLQHTAASGGKRIRPALVLTACEAVGGDFEKILAAAASVELLHTFTLVHDDIMDDDDMRRGKPTVHALWGIEIGIVVGDAVYAKAFESLVDVRNEGIDDSKVLDALETLNHANSEVHEGQMMDMFFEKQKEVTEQDYLVMISKKTGALIEASVKIGAILGGGTDEQIRSLSDYGRDIGMAFQIKDDLLDLTGDEQKLGKPVGSDICQGKKSLVIVHALAHGSEKQKKSIFNALGKDCDEEKISELIAVLNEVGSIKYAENKLLELIGSAKKSLEEISDGEPKEILLDLADYIIERTH